MSAKSFAVKAFGWVIYATGVFCILLSIPKAAAQTDPVYWIAFIGWPQYIENPGCSGLCIVRSDGSEVRSLTEDISFGSPLAWSPDGKWLAYSTNANDLMRILVEDQREPVLLADRWQILRAKGVSEQEIEQLQNEADTKSLSVRSIGDIIWSAYDQRLYLDVHTGILQYDPVKDNLVKVSDTPIDFFSSMSPDNGEILFTTQADCGYPASHMYRFSIDDYSAHPIGEKQCVTHPYWSSDSHIYFIQQSPDNTRLSIERVDPVNDIYDTIAANIQTERYVWDFAATAHFVYFISTVDGVGKVHVLDLSTLTLPTIPETPGYEFEQIAPSPVSDMVALNGATAATMGGAGIYLMQPDGEFRTLTQGNSEIYNPIWSPVPIDS